MRLLVCGFASPKRTSFRMLLKPIPAAQIHRTSTECSWKEKREKRMLGRNWELLGKAYEVLIGRRKISRKSEL